MLVKLPRKDTTTVVATLAKHVRKLPEQLRRSLTWDQGKEMHAHKRFTIATNVQVYFCDPRSPWQRGNNENTNGLVRQYFPRGTNSRASPKRISMRLPCDSINVRERPWASKPQPINDKPGCTDRLNSHPERRPFPSTSNRYPLTQPHDANSASSDLNTLCTAYVYGACLFRCLGEGSTYRLVCPIGNRPGT